MKEQTPELKTTKLKSTDNGAPISRKVPVTSTRQNSAVAKAVEKKSILKPQVTRTTSRATAPPANRKIAAPKGSSKPLIGI